MASRTASHEHVHVLSEPMLWLRKLYQEWIQNNWNYAIAKRNAEFHHSIHPKMFEHFLGETVGYSEGYWTDNTKNLNFPGGNLPSLPYELMMMEKHGIMLVEVENLWPHYQRTVKEWRNRFTEFWPEIQKADPVFFTERFRRIWSMYLEGTTEVFSNSLDLSHMLFTKGRSSTYYPWMREEKHQADFREGDQEVECYPLEGASSQSFMTPAFPVRFWETSDPARNSKNSQ